jgi:hypothetical protein
MAVSDGWIGSLCHFNSKGWSLSKGRGSWEQVASFGLWQPKGDCSAPRWCFFCSRRLEGIWQRNHGIPPRCSNCWGNLMAIKESSTLAPSHGLLSKAPWRTKAQTSSHLMPRCRTSPSTCSTSKPTGSCKAETPRWRLASEEVNSVSQRTRSQQASRNHSTIKYWQA